MPLKPGAPVGDTIRELYHHGSRPRSRAQIIAIAEANHRKGMAGGGGLKAAAMQHTPKGGIFGSLNMKPPHSLGRVEEPIAPLAKSGFLHSVVPGRTDRLATRVKSGSHIIPADVVGAMGQGNSLAGARHLDLIMRSLPQAFADGGKADLPHRRLEHTPVLLAGGEYVIDPREVRAIGRGNQKKGHDILDKMIVNIRNKEAKRMLKLPGPKK